MADPKIFVSYSHADQKYKAALLKHFAPLIRNGVQVWNDGDVSPGEDLQATIMNNLNSCNIFVPLVSPDFLSSPFITQYELPRALERRERGEIEVISVILRPAQWLNTPLAKMLVLPKDGKPISTFGKGNKDSAFVEVVMGLSGAIERVRTGNISKMGQSLIGAGVVPATTNQSTGKIPNPWE